MKLDVELKAPALSIVDTHAHYDDAAFDDGRDQLLELLHNNGVKYIINNATELDTSAAATLNIAENHNFCFAAFGLHPEVVEQYGTALDEVRLRKYLQYEKCVAVGEIGLDYHYSSDRKELQKEVFRRQCEIANEVGLPVIIHDREAHGDMYDILREVRPAGVIHCFSGSRELATETVKQGLYIGIGGILTFKNARKLVEVAEAVPLEKILLETDAPYCTPVPYRGKVCHSAHIYYTALRLAEIKGITVSEVLCATARNAERLFKLKKG